MYKKSRNSVGVREEGGWWCYFLAIKIWKFRGVVGAYVKFPPWGNAHIFWKALILDTLRNRPFVRGLSS